MASRHKDPEFVRAVEGMPCIPCLDALPPRAALRALKGLPRPRRSIAHRLKTAKSGGPDAPWNLLPVCPHCYYFIKEAGLAELARQNDTLALWLQEAGWFHDPRLDRWRHPLE